VGHQLEEVRDLLKLQLLLLVQTPQMLFVLLLDVVQNVQVLKQLGNEQELLDELLAVRVCSRLRDHLPAHYPVLHVLLVYGEQIFRDGLVTRRQKLLQGHPVVL